MMFPITKKVRIDHMLVRRGLYSLFSWTNFSSPRRISTTTTIQPIIIDHVLVFFAIYVLHAFEDGKSHAVLSTLGSGFAFTACWCPVHCAAADSSFLATVGLAQSDSVDRPFRFVGDVPERLGEPPIFRCLECIWKVANVKLYKKFIHGKK